MKYELGPRQIAELAARVNACDPHCKHTDVDEEATIAYLNGQLMELQSCNDKQAKRIGDLILVVLVLGGLLALVIVCSILWGR